VSFSKTEQRKDNMLKRKREEVYHCGSVNRELFVGNVPRKTNTVELMKKAFSRFGNVEFVQFNPNDNFCFVKFVKV